MVLTLNACNCLLKEKVGGGFSKVYNGKEGDRFRLGCQ